MTYRYPVLTPLLSALLTLALGACAGDDTSGESEGDSDATSDSSTGSTSTSGGSTSTSGGSDPSSTGETTGGSTSGGGSGFADGVFPIFSANCSCHVAGTPGGLSLKDSLTAYAALVDVPSGQSVLLRVAPGDVANSYLVHKLKGTQVEAGGSGTEMPQGAAPLSGADMTTITDWIEAGAPND